VEGGRFGHAVRDSAVQEEAVELKLGRLQERDNALVRIARQARLEDRFKFGTRRIFEPRELEESLGICFKFRIIVYDVGSAMRNHFPRVCHNCAHS
jgi:hypothetical protein